MDASGLEAGHEKDSAHSVQFYVSDERLLASLASFVGDGLEAHDAIIVVATKFHRDELDRRLTDQGFDVSTLRSQGEYVVLDAAEVLSKFMVGGQPDADRFAAVLLPFIEQAEAAGRRLRIYGEMVALLWADGNHKATIELEKMWNDLRKRKDFSLLCGYPVQPFDTDPANSIADVCAAHSAVVPMEIDTEIHHGFNRLRSIVALEQKNKALQAEIKRREEIEEELRASKSELNDFSEQNEEAQSFLAAIVESANDAIIGKTLEGIITSWNPGAQQVFGYSAEETIGKPVRILIPADLQDEESRILERLRNGERIENYETRRLRKDGTIIEVSLTVSPVRNGQNQIIGASKIARDITDRKLVQVALASYKDGLERQVEDLKRLHEISFRLTKTINMDSVFDEVLEAALDAQRTSLGVLSLYEAESNRLIVKASRGLNSDLLACIEHFPAEEGAFGACFGAKERVIVEDVDLDPNFTPYRDLARKTSFQSVHSTPLSTRHGRIIGVLSVLFRQPYRPSEHETWFMDLYARMAADFIENARLHQQLQQQLADRDHLLLREQIARSEAEEANRKKDEFLATASHELRTPLNAIIGWCHVLRNRELDRKTMDRAIDTIDRNAKAQAQLIEDILDVSRVVTGKLQLNIVKVDLSAVINSAIDSIQLAAMSKGIRLEVTADPLARQVSGDPVRLQQVVWNLLSNAIKFTPPGGTICVKLNRADSNIQIAVCDTGDGIEPEFLPLIFNRFSQGDSSTTRRQGGLGLGLAIVKHLVEIHGGSVSAESAGRGRGATFVIQLPAVKPTDVLDEFAVSAERLPRKLRTSDGPHSLQNIEGVRLLIVDDNRDTTNLLSATLIERKALIQTANSVEDALDILKWYKPQVLISDLAMPDEDGYSFISKVRQMDHGENRKVRAIALTALVRIEDRARALTAGFDMFVPKPVEPSELVTVISQLLEPRPILD